jgi:hypothetical protein
VVLGLETVESVVVMERVEPVAVSLVVSVLGLGDFAGSGLGLGWLGDFLGRQVG